MWFLERWSRKTESAVCLDIRIKVDLKIIKYVMGYCKTKGFFMSTEDRTIRISCRKTMLDLSQKSNEQQQNTQ